MKTLKFKLSSLFILGMCLSSFAIQDTSKEIHREVNVNSDVLVKINNQFGDVKISSWEENKVVIDVVISVKGSNQKRINEKLDEIDVDFSLSPERVSAKTLIDKDWGFKWFKGSKLHFRIDYTIKLPRSSSVDLENDYGAILLNELEGRAEISCDFGKLVLGDLHHEDNLISFDYTKNSTIDFIKGGEIRADFSDFEVLEAGAISLVADYSNSRFNTLEKLKFRNDYGKLNVDKINELNGVGDFLTLRVETLFQKLDLNQNFGSIRIAHINPSATTLSINSEYTGVYLGIDPDWEFTYDIAIEFAKLKTSFPLQHLIQKEDHTNKKYKGYFNNENSTNRLHINSEFGVVKLNKTLF